MQHVASKSLASLRGLGTRPVQPHLASMKSIEFLLANCSPSDLLTSRVVWEGEGGERMTTITSLPPLLLRAKEQSNLVDLVPHQHLDEVLLGGVGVQLVQPDVQPLKALP